MGDLNVIILAGGAGTRFEPLKNKNLYRFLGRNSFEIHTSQVEPLKPKKVIIVTNLTTPSIQCTGAETVVQSGSGMAGAVLTALEKIDGDDEVLVLDANDYYDDSLINNFSKIKDELLKSNECMITGHKTDKYFPGGYLILNGNTITGIVEKPGEGNEPSNFVSIVFDYFPKANDLKGFLSDAKSRKDDVFEVAMDNMMKSSQKFRMLPYDGEWKTIKYPWHVLDVMDMFLKKIDKKNISKKADISPNAYVNGNVIIEDGVKIYDGAVINGPVYLGKNTIVANNALVRESMVGENCVVGFSTEVARSYLKEDVWLHKNYVGDSILESNVSLGSNTVTGNLRLDEQNIFRQVNGERVDTQRNKLGTIIGSDVRIGINVNIMPGISIGRNSFIGPNVNVETDIGEGKFVKLNQNLKITENRFNIQTTSREDFISKILSR